MSDFIDILSPKAYSDLQLANKDLIEMIKHIEKINSLYKTAKTPTQSAKVTQEATKAIEQQEKAIERARLAEIRLQQSREKAFDKYEAQLQKEAQQLQKSESLYNKVQAKVNALSATYNNLAIKKQLGLKLNTREEAQLISLESRLNKYQTALKTVDANIQKNQRNVGNYRSGFDGLSNSINQITRELPAFTFSAQTGFLALSNNIPILVDEIQRLKVANQELVAQGKPVKSTFASILGSLLSFQTAMGVGILLFTVYGKEIGEFVSNLFKSKVALSQSEEQAKRYGQTMQEVNKTLARIGADEISRSKILFETAKNTTLSYEQRMKAVNDLQSLYPDYLRNLSKEQILAGETAKAENELAQALINRATAMAAIEMIEENARKRLEAQKQLALELNEVERVRAEWGAKRVYAKSLEEEAELNKERNDILAQTYATEALANIRFKEKIARLDEEENILMRLFNENAKYLNIVKSGTNTNKSNTESVKEAINAQENSELAFKTNIQALEKMREKLTIGSSAYQFLTSQIELMRLAQKSLNEEFEAFDVEESVGNIGLKMQTQLPQIQAVVEELEKYKVSLADLQPLFSDAFNFADVFFQNEIDKYDALINKSNEYYDALIANAEDGSAQEIALQEEKRKAEEKLEEKKRQAEIKAFRFRQLASVAEIAINTAIAISKVLAQTGVVAPALIPLIIAQGALQTATVLAQQPPAYAEGTDYHKGGDAYVGDGGKREVMITPDGKMRITPDETTLIKNMPIGTKVLPDAEVFLRNLMLNQAFGMHKEIDNTKHIEKAIERGFKKAKVNNYLSLPKIDLGHHYYKQKGL